MTTVVVRGVNEFGSAIAHALVRAGVAVVLHDGPQPMDCHRGMAFTDAVFDGSADLDGLAARLVDQPAAIVALLSRTDVVPVTTAPLDTVLASVSPAVLVDARMRKRERPERQRGLAPLTIGLGPGFVGGANVDLAVETGFGADFGRAYADGPTRDLSGEPPPVLGHGRERFLYAPADGLSRTSRAIGDPVAAGETVATLDGDPLHAPVDGALRGLTRDGVPVTAGIRVIEVDPRGPDAVSRGIGTRQASVATVVLDLIQRGGAALSSSGERSETTG